MHMDKGNSTEIQFALTYNYIEKKKKKSSKFRKLSTYDETR